MGLSTFGYRSKVIIRISLLRKAQRSRSTSLQRTADQHNCPVERLMHESRYDRFGFTV